MIIETITAGSYKTTGGTHRVGGGIPKNTVKGIRRVDWMRLILSDVIPSSTSMPAGRPPGESYLPRLLVVIHTGAAALVDTATTAAAARSIQLAAAGLLDSDTLAAAGIGILLGDSSLVDGCSTAGSGVSILLGSAALVDASILAGAGLGIALGACASVDTCLTIAAGIVPATTFLRWGADGLPVNRQVKLRDLLEAETIESLPAGSLVYTAADDELGVLLPPVSGPKLLQWDSGVLSWVDP